MQSHSKEEPASPRPTSALKQFLAEFNKPSPAEAWEQYHESVREAERNAAIDRRIADAVMNANVGHVPAVPAVVKPLDGRELRIWTVIKMGNTGLQYCRDLDNAGIAPRRTGRWKLAWARKYSPLYSGGDPKENKRWQHRINDEKYKVEKHAKLLGLAGE